MILVVCLYDRRPVHGAPRLLPYDSWERVLRLDKQEKMEE